MKFEMMANSDWPAGPGNRWLTSDEFWELMEKITKMAPGSVMRIPKPGTSKCSGHSLRSQIIRQLKKKHLAPRFSVITRKGDSGVYDVWVRRDS